MSAPDERPAPIVLTFADAFTPGDVVSEWVCVLGMTVNDLVVVHDRLEKDQENKALLAYWARLSFAHFREAGKLLDKTDDAREVAAFVQSLPKPIRAEYQRALESFREIWPLLKDHRDVTFHYLDPDDERLTKALSRLAREGETFDVRFGKVRDVRHSFADNVMAELLVELASGGPDNEMTKHEKLAKYEELVEKTGVAVTSFMRFAGSAIGEYLRVFRYGAASQEEPADP